MAIYSADTIRDFDAEYTETGNCVRPINHECDSLFSRIKQAWLVFTGRCDVLKWSEPPVTKSTDGSNHTHQEDKSSVFPPHLS